MPRSLQQSRTLITGASSGIGKAIALELASRQGRLVLLARRADRLAEVQQEVVSRGGQAVSIVGDVTNPEDRHRAIGACRERFNGLDVLINNAGVGAIGPFAAATPDRLETVMGVNFVAPVELIRLALPLLKESHGGIVNVCSVLGHRAVPGKSEYCASKFALHGFSDALRAELRADNVDVTLISPSTTRSEFFDALGQEHQRRGMLPSKVAQVTIKAIERGRSEVIMPVEGKLLVMLDRLCPPLANFLVAKFG